MPRWPAKIEGRRRVRGLLSPLWEERGYKTVQSGGILELWHHRQCLFAFTKVNESTLETVCQQDWLRR